MAPMTIPAIAPPVKPWWDFDAAAAALEVAATDVPVGVVVIVSVTTSQRTDEAKIGKVTPLHRLSEPENTQHESVELGELAAQ